MTHQDLEVHALRRRAAWAQFGHEPDPLRPISIHGATASSTSRLGTRTSASEPYSYVWPRCEPIRNRSRPTRCCSAVRQRACMAWRGPWVAIPSGPPPKSPPDTVWRGFSRCGVSRSGIPYVPGSTSGPSVSSWSPTGTNDGIPDRGRPAPNPTPVTVAPSNLHAVRRFASSRACGCVGPCGGAR